MTVATFALLEFDSARFAQFLVNMLAVAGGYLLGLAVFGSAAWMLDRWLTGGKSPEGLKRAIRIVGGIGTAVLVALIVFGHGAGWNLFGGGGGGNGNGTTEQKGGEGKGSGETSSPVSQANNTESPVTPQPKATAAPEDRIRITLLGGEDVKEMRFYLIGDDPTPRTLSEVKAAVTAQRDKSKRPIGLEIRFAAKNTLPQTHPAVLLLADWARANDVPVTFPASKP